MVPVKQYGDVPTTDEFIIDIPQATSEPWNVQFCNIFHGLKGQKKGNQFVLTFDVMWSGYNDEMLNDESDNNETKFYIMTGKSIIGGYDDIHEDYQFSAENTELIDVEGVDIENSWFSQAQGILKTIPNGEWTTVTYKGTIGEKGAEYIGIDMWLAYGVGSFYFKNVNVKIGNETELKLTANNPVFLGEIFKNGDLYYKIVSSKEPYAVEVTAEDGYDDYRSIDYYSNLKTVTIPEKVTYAGKQFSVRAIGNLAFLECPNIETISIPNTVDSIGLGAFAYCLKLKAINVDAKNKNYVFEDGILFSKDKTTLICCCPAGKNGDYSVPTSVSSINTYAFSGCAELESVIIPISVDSVGTYAFFGCDSLTIYCEAETEPSGWGYWIGYFTGLEYLKSYKDGKWNVRNSDENNKDIYGKVVWGYKPTENQGNETNNTENQGTKPNPQPLTPEEIVAQTINNIMGIIHAVITDDGEMAVNEVNIYAHHNTIVVENATDEILVYNAMGRIVGRDVARNVCTIKINNSGVYIVKTGNVVKRVMVN